MTSPTGYTAEQALARDLLNVALNGGASVYWAHVHGVHLDGSPEQVRAEGIHLSDRSVWSVDLDDITGAVNELIRYPELAAEPGAVSDARTLPYVSSALYTGRQQDLRRVADLPVADADYTPAQAHELIADVVFQLAATGAVIR